MESATSIPSVQEEVDDFDTANGGGGSVEAIAITFFSECLGEETLADLDPSKVLGQVIVINYKISGSQDYSYSYVYESKFRIPEVQLSSVKTTRLLNNYIHCDSPLDITVEGKTYSLLGVYYAQQNRITSVCAHACLKMLLNTLKPHGNEISTRYINQLLNVATPILSLELQHIEQVIRDSGLEPLIHDCRASTQASTQTGTQTGTQAAPSDEYLQVLHSILDSGFSALLGFTTAGPTEHVVFVCGYTLNTDEWHPQAFPGYSGAPSGEYYPSSAWVDHLIIHDDNYGPYYSLSSRSLLVDPTIEPLLVIGILPRKVGTGPLEAQTISSAFLNQFLPQIKAINLVSGRWFDYISDCKWRFVMRTTLMEKDQYLDHLKNLQAHDGTRLTQSEVDSYKALPDFFWCAEFSLPNIFSGNRSKLGEVFVDAISPYDQNQPTKSVLGIRGPSFMALSLSAGQFALSPSSVCSHAPLHRLSDHDHEW